MSEWLKWQQMIMETSDPTLITYVLRCMHCLFNSRVRQLTGLLLQLIVDSLSHLLQHVSQIKTQQCSSLSLGNIQRSLHCRQAHQHSNSWIPEYLQTKELPTYVALQPLHSWNATFDTGSYSVLIDNCCTACITNCIQYFCVLPSKTKSSVSGSGGPIGITLQGILNGSSYTIMAGITHSTSPMPTMCQTHLTACFLWNIGVRWPSPTNHTLDGP